MSRLRSHLVRLCAVLVAAAALAAFPAAGRQLAKAQKQAAASGQQSAGGSVPLRVGLVIGDEVRSYRQTVFLTRFEFGRRLANQAELVFNQTFSSVRSMRELSADPHAYDGLDLIVVVEGPEGSYRQSGLFTGTMSLTVRFTVRDARGAQLFQLQETDTEKGSNANNIEDRLGETVSRKFVQDLLLTPRVREMLAPAPRVEPKVQLADTASMDSAGLDVPPPPPWRSAPAPAASLPAPAQKP
jgi:hypothetical protein